MYKHVISQKPRNPENFEEVLFRTLPTPTSTYASKYTKILGRLLKLAAPAHNRWMRPVQARKQLKMSRRRFSG